MAKTNFQYEKRQKELEKKRKNEEKARRKLENKNKPHDSSEGDAEGGAAPLESEVPAAGAEPQP
jgi:hypothetical protein